MVTKEDRDLALNALIDLIPSNEPKKNWLNWLLYVGEPDPEIEKMKTLIRDISPSMGWDILDMDVPDEMIPRLVVDSLGNNLFMSKKIRKFVCERYLEIKSEGEITNLINLVGCSSSQDLLEKMLDHNFTRASNTSFGILSFTKVYCLPAYT